MDITITLLQTELHWHDREANLEMFANKLDTLATPTDLVVLPEMFTTGFSMEAAELAEEMEGPALTWMRQMAQRQQAVVTGSLIVKEKDRYYNRLLWVRPDSTFAHYDKRHLFRMAGEEKVYAPGRERLVVELKGWKICPLVCYDLRFPVWSRNTADPYDLLLYVANWPEPRRQAWRSLLQARAIENVAYCVGLNRVGTDGKGIAYAGDSAVINFKGDHLVQAAQVECMPTVTLSKKELGDFREKFPAHLDADSFTIH